MTLPEKISSRNFYAFLWHAGFLALAQNFMDVDTVMPAMIIDSGGGAVHIGILTAIMMGGSSVTQLIFAPYISRKSFKKKYLLIGINSRVLSLFALGVILFFLHGYKMNWILWLIFVFISLFALGGAFSNISYTDILGKSVNQNKRKLFFSAKQIIAGILVLFSAFMAKRILTISDYPLNYSYMFFAGAGLLLIATAGFWNIRESIPSELKIKGFRDYMTTLRSELTRNGKLAYFLGFINTQGISMSFLPFVMLYARSILNTQSAETGYFLLFKVSGIVLISLLVFFTSKWIKYNPLLYINVILSILVILLTLSVRDEHGLRYIFILGGIVYSLYSITMNGLLLEVSVRENRALYTGFAGAGNILPAIFPLAGGLIINRFGFKPFFVLFMIIVTFSLYFIRKIDCKK